MKHILIVIILCITQLTFAQLVIEQLTDSNRDLKTEDILLGDGVEVLGVKVYGNSKQIGSFTGAETIGLNEGLLIATGDINETANHSDFNLGLDSVLENSGFENDPDIIQLLSDIGESSDANNAIIIEVDFIPSSYLLTFDFLFASEEYPLFSCSEFFDVFGMILSDEDSNWTNLALIPFTNDPISIKTIHPSFLGCPGANEQFYNDGSTEMAFNGFTDVFTARADVTPCKEYKLRFIIFNVRDQGFPSGIFIRKNSFDASLFSTQLITKNGGNISKEDCAGGDKIVVTLDKEQVRDIPFKITILSTENSIENGIDIPEIPTTFTIGETELEYEIDLSPVLDGIVEVAETLKIVIEPIIDCERAELKDTIEYILYDEASLEVELNDVVICNGDEKVIRPIYNNFIEDLESRYRYKWLDEAGNLLGVEAFLEIESLPDSFAVSLEVIDPFGCVYNNRSTVSIFEFVENIGISCEPSSDQIIFNFQYDQENIDLEVSLGNDVWISPNLNSIQHGVYNLEENEQVNISVRAKLSCNDTIFEQTCSAITCELEQEYLNITDNACENDSLGLIDIKYVSPYLPIVYSLSEFENNTGLFENLYSNNYEIKITDGIGCSQSEIVNIGFKHTGIDIEYIKKDLSCYGSGDGKIELVAKNATEPLDVSWNNGQKGSTLSNLEKGIYTYWVQNREGCQDSGLVNITEPDSIGVIFESQHLECFNETRNFSLGITPFGGVTPYQIIWSNGEQNVLEILNVENEMYSVKLTDVNGCTQEDSFYVEIPLPLARQIDATPVKCYGVPNGEIELFLENQEEGFRAVLTQGDRVFTPPYTNLPAGEYHLNISMDNCEMDTIIFIPSPDEPNLSLPNDTLVEFGDRLDFKVEEVINLGSELNYTWSFSAPHTVNCTDCSNIELFPYNTGFLNVHISDEHGCQVQDSVQIYVNNQHRINYTNAISTNSTESLNQSFSIYGNTDIEILSFSVYERWGGLIYQNQEISSSNQLWDGRDFNGESLKTGVYIWSANVRFPDGHVQLFSGDINVLQH